MIQLNKIHPLKDDPLSWWKLEKFLMLAAFLIF